MKFIYGLPCIEIEQPDGELVDYLLRQVVPEGDERAAYVVTKPDGEENRCSDLGGNHWQCTCKAFVYRDRHDVEKRGRCKHIRGVVEALQPATEQELVGAS